MADPDARMRQEPYLALAAATPGKYKNNRSKSACTLNARKRLNNQAVWPVIFDITGPICVRALKTMIPLTLGPCGHHDWPVMSDCPTSWFALAAYSGRIRSGPRCLVGCGWQWAFLPRCRLA